MIVDYVQELEDYFYLIWLISELLVLDVRATMTLFQHLFEAFCKNLLLLSLSIQHFELVFIKKTLMIF